MELLSKSNSKRALNVFTLVMINIIAIDSLRNLPANAEVGFSIAFFYLLGGVLFLLPSALLTAELATHYPKTGGVYVWVREAFGAKWGFFNIWLQWIYNIIWYPTILSFVAANIAYLIDPMFATNKLFMVSMIIAMFSLSTIMNLFGMKISGVVSTISALVGSIIPMLIIIGLGTAWIFAGKPLAITPTISGFFPNLEHMNNMAFLVIVLFSLMGLEMSAVHAGDVKNPQRDYPRALYFSSLLIILTMVFASAAIAIVVPKADLNIITGLDQAFAMFLNAFHLKWLLPVAVLMIILGGFGGMSAWVIGPTKGLMVAAEDGCTPKIFGQRNSKGVPIVILVIQWAVVLIICGLMLFVKTISTSYWILSDLSAQLALMFYIIFFAAAIRLRYITPRNEKAFRVPGGKVGIWIVGGVGIISCVVAIFLGFLIPDGVHITNPLMYRVILIVGILVFALPPLFIARHTQKPTL